MKGSKRIAEYLKEKRNINIERLEDINYKIEKLGEGITKTTITSNSGLFSPVYCICDGYYMHWYGDYGAWSFCATWKTDISNLPYNNPEYMFGKLESRDRFVYDEDAAQKELLESIQSGLWYETREDDEKARFDEYITTPYDYIATDDILSCYDEDELDQLKELYSAAGEDEYSFISKVRDCDISILEYFDCEESDLYSMGRIIHPRLYIIMYLLSVVAYAENGCPSDD